MAHWPNRPWEHVGFVVHAGALHDFVGYEGVAHFVEHMVSEIISLPKKEIQKFFNLSGGSAMFGCTSFTNTEYSFFISQDHEKLNRSLDIFGEMLFYGKLRDAMERERQVIIEEFNRMYPVHIELEIEMRRNYALFQEGRLRISSSPIGTHNAISTITPQDVQLFYDQYYVLANVSMVCVGGFTHNEIIGAIDHSIISKATLGARSPMCKSISVTKPTETLIVTNLSDYVSSVIFAGTYQSQCVFSHQESYESISLFCQVLDHIMTEDIREKRGWTYSISCTFDDCGVCYIITIECRAFRREKADQICDAIDKCIKSVKDQKELFEEIKQSVLAEKCMVDRSARDICEMSLADVGKKSSISTLAEDHAHTLLVSMDDMCRFSDLMHSSNRCTILWK